MTEANASRSAVVEARTRRRSLLLDRWPAAFLRAGLAAAVVAAVAMVIAALIVAGGLLPGTSAGTAIREGWLLFYAFHHVGIEVISSSLRLPMHADTIAGLPAGYAVDATVGVAFLGGTLLAVWLLYRGGRGVAGSGGGSAVVRGIHASKVGVAYALISWLASWGPSFQPGFPNTSPMSVHPSHVSSLFWPLAIGVGAAFAGGVRSAEGSVWASDWWAGETWNRRWRGVLAGGWRMSILAFGLSVAALVCLGAVHPGDTAAYFRTVFAGTTLAGVVLMLLTALALPNLAVWLLIPAMGGCAEISGSALYQPWCFLSYGAFLGNRLPGPPGPSGFPQLGSAPGWTYVLLLVPFLAVLLGGMRAAKRSDARTRGEGVLVGALAGLVFALVLTVVAALAMVTARFNGPFYLVGTGLLRYGPNPGTAFEIGLLWGVAGGAAGGGWHGPGPPPRGDGLFPASLVGRRPAG